MSIAQQVDTIYSQSEKIFCPLSKQEIEELKLRGQLDPSNSRVYQMEYMAQLLQVQCPYILQEDGSYVLVLSTEKFPYRRYPSHVYFYAAILHVLGWSMRESARRCRRLFGLAKFSHSTISRLFQRLDGFVRQLEDLAEESLPEKAKANELTGVRNSAVAIIAKDLAGSIPYQIRPGHLRWRLFAALNKLLASSLVKPCQTSWLILPVWQRYGVLLL